MAAVGTSGHRAVPHTADLRIEAWAPSPQGCLAEAVHAMVESVVDVADAEQVATREVPLSGNDPAAWLVTLLDDVIYLMDVHGELPREVSVEPGDDGLVARLAMVDAEVLPTVGAVPKAVALHELRFSGDADGWRCSVTLDV